MLVGLAEHRNGWMRVSVELVSDFLVADRWMMIGTILLIILILLLIGAFPSWPYSGNWGYYPSGGIGLLLIILIILLIAGRI